MPESASREKPDKPPPDRPLIPLVACSECSRDVPESRGPVCAMCIGVRVIREVPVSVRYGDQR